MTTFMLIKLSEEDYKGIAKFFKDNPRRKVCNAGSDDHSLTIRKSNPKIQKYLKEMNDSEKKLDLNVKKHKESSL